MEGVPGYEEQARQLADAVNVTMNPAIDKQSRMNAYQLCESFKESSPHCVPCGALLADRKHSPIIRHFGLQLLEHYVRFKWNDASVEDKVQFKDLILALITKGSRSVFEDENYIKEGQVKIMVEMIKREWPQQWPTLLAELDLMCQMGDSPTELVLLILLRLVEDVVSFQNIPQQKRRRDLHQALTANMGQISAFLIRVLQMYFEKYQSSLEGQSNDESKSACKVIQTVLLTLCGFVEWIDFKHLFQDDKRLLTILYMLLSKAELKMYAAECLKLIVNRKGNKEERKPLIVLLCDVAMKELLDAAREACSAGIDETNHLFVTKLCQVITGLGSQICAIWSATAETYESPANLASYLQALFAFTQHPSTHVSSLTSSSWTAFLRHRHMSRDPAVLDILPSLCQTFTNTFQKVGFPSRSDSLACQYAKIDFDSDDEFFNFFIIHRLHQRDILQYATSLLPVVAFNIAAHWLRELLAAPLQREEGKDLCTSHCPSYIKWDAMTGYLDSVITSLIKEKQLPVAQTVELLQATLSLTIEDPMILSCQLTCISTLFPVLHHSKQHVEAVLDKLFAAAVYSLPGLTKKTRTRSVQNVRRHACSAMVTMSRDHQDLMLPHFEKIYSQVQTLSSDPDQLTQLERVTLNEALILINNGLNEWTSQSALIAEIMKPITEVWLSDTITHVIQSPELFIHHIGLDCPSGSVKRSQEDVYNRNRAQLFNCISTCQAVVKRSCWPSDPQVAEAGGYVSGRLPSGAPIYRNPSTPHIMPLLPNLFTLTRTLNAMWSPECRAKVCPEYTKSYDMTESERNTILGLLGNSNEIPSNKPVVEKVQTFLTVIYETICHLFSDCFHCLGHEFYSAEGLADQLLGSFVANLHPLPDYRLRHIIRVFSKYFVQYCPTECWQSVLVPVIAGLTTYMVHRLDQQWTVIAHRKEASREDADDEQEAQEVVQDHLTRAVTKEFMELFGSLCWSKRQRASSSRAGGGKEEGAELEMEMEEGMEQTAGRGGGGGGGGGQQHPDTETISELCKVALQNDKLCESMVTCVYAAMSWADTGVCIKACQLSWLIMQELAQRQLHSEAVRQLYTSILRGLQVHGEHDTCRTELVHRAMLHYELLRERYPILTEVMLRLPGCDEQALHKFHQKGTATKAQKKEKKDAFKTLVQGVIGENVGQKYKQNEVIKDLPSILKPKKPKLSLLDTEPEDAGLVMLFAGDVDL